MSIPAFHGRVAALWRYPVKSMQGEAIAQAWFDQRGMLGDRCFALFDCATETIASAKHPRLWGRLLQCQAAFVEQPVPGHVLPPVLITFPDSHSIRSDDLHVNQVLSDFVERKVQLIDVAPAQPMREALRDDTIRREPLGRAAPLGSFFDYAPIHIITESTLHYLKQQASEQDFDLRRFRPNIIFTATRPDVQEVEQSWFGSTLTFGDSLQLTLIDPSPRCVVVTLAQAMLPANPTLLKLLAQTTQSPSYTLAPGTVFRAVVGVYARTTESGYLHVDDALYVQA